MSDEKKKPDEEVTEGKTEQAEPAQQTGPEKPPEKKPTEAAESEEKAEGETVPEKDEKPPESGTESETEDAAAPPELPERRSRGLRGETKNSSRRKSEKPRRDCKLYKAGFDIKC